VGQVEMMKWQNNDGMSYQGWRFTSQVKSRLANVRLSAFASDVAIAWSMKQYDLQAIGYLLI
jgi:hypothetical protein